jgi:dUTPase
VRKNYKIKTKQKEKIKMKKKIVMNAIPEVLPKLTVSRNKGISEKSDVGHLPIGKKKEVKVAVVKQSKDEKKSKETKKVAETFVVPVAKVLDKIKELVFTVLKKSADGKIKSASMEVSVPLDKKYKVLDKGKITDRDYLRAIYTMDVANKMSQNSLLINNYLELAKSQYNSIHVAVGKLVKNKIDAVNKAAVVKVEKKLRQLKKDEKVADKKSKSKKISAGVPPITKKK